MTVPDGVMQTLLVALHYAATPLEGRNVQTSYREAGEGVGRLHGTYAAILKKRHEACEKNRWWFRELKGEKPRYGHPSQKHPSYAKKHLEDVPEHRWLPGFGWPTAGTSCLVLALKALKERRPITWGNGKPAPAWIRFRPQDPQFGSHEFDKTTGWREDVDPRARRLAACKRREANLDLAGAAAVGRAPGGSANTAIDVTANDSDADGSAKTVIDVTANDSDAEEEAHTVIDVDAEDVFAAPQPAGATQKLSLQFRVRPAGDVTVCMSADLVSTTPAVKKRRRAAPAATCPRPRLLPPPASGLTRPRAAAPKPSVHTIYCSFDDV